MPTPVVICDDSSMARKQIARALPEGWDVDVVFATNGAEALEAVKGHRAEVLFLDLTMPVMDGYETLQALRQQADSPTKVIVVSGDIQPDARRRVLELGALEFLKKPIDQEQLTEVLGQLNVIGGAPSAGDRAGGIAIDVDIRDCYREVANVALGQAADLLARLLDVFVILPVPQVNTLEVAELQMALTSTERYDSISAVCQGYTGAGIAGEALLLFNDASFQDIARLMKYDGELDETVELELLMDIANILIGACLNGIAEQLDIKFSQGHPTVLGRHCNVSELIATNSARWTKTLAIEINYAIEDYHINCDLLLLFTEDSVQTLNNKIGHLLDA
jgi:CheY-like chemotaxis protein